MGERYIDEKNIDEEPSQEASVRIWAGADAVFRGEDKWRSCRGEEGGGEETARPKKGLFVPLEKEIQDFDFLEFRREDDDIISKVLEKSVSMMESFQGGEEVLKTT